jgi:hypothetical protein
MTKEQIINEMKNKANQMCKDGYSREVEDELWTMASDNDIFMCEYYMDEEGNTTEENQGFMIEDDYWLYKNM